MTKNRTALPPMVCVHWRDASHSQEEWVIEALGGLEELYDVGFLLKETDESITIGMEYQHGNASTRNWLTIPRVNLIDIRHLQFKAQRKAVPKQL